MNRLTQFLLATVLPLAAALAAEPFPVIDTQKTVIKLTTPGEALAAIKLPNGFRATLFAAEPDVRQPIAMTTDERGRLWVAENYTYAERPVVLDERHRDRIIIFEDSDGDGRCDRRTVFWDQAKQLTSVEVGFGGVWAMCPPKLLFLPDANGDHVMDGEPIEMLDGFDLGAANHHNFANGLKWGPDGWLYGRNGISNVGHVGVPGTPAEERLTVDPGVWRFHPQTKRVEMVCAGSTNPWGYDWNDEGELFFINTVIGHLWHAVPGAHFKRMFGADSNPYVYELIDQSADHVHWDAAEGWQDAKKGLSKSTDQAGGGHAHCGMMIYLGDNWPQRYRGQLFTINMHGRRVNCDYLERQGASYVGKHGDDFLFSGDPWFRGIELLYGRDGGVYLADWSDIGECHESDGVHRNSGRIFKVKFQGATAEGNDGGTKHETLDLKQLGNLELAKLQLHKNDWYVRQARRILQERAVGGQDMREVHTALRTMYAEQVEPSRKLRALWALHVTGGLSESWLMYQLAHKDEHVRAWVVRLLVDRAAPSPRAVDALTKQAAADTSGLVLLYLASSLQRISYAQRWPLAAALSSRAKFASDRVLPLMIWYGIEAAVPKQPNDAIALAQSA